MTYINDNNDDDEFDNAEFEEEFDFDEHDDEIFDEIDTPDDLSGSTAAPPAQPTPPSSIDRSKYLAIAGFVGAAVVGYGIYSSMKSPDEMDIGDVSPSDLSIESIQQSESNQIPEDSVTQSNWDKETSFDMEEEQAAKKLKEVMMKLERQKAESSQQIKQLENTLEKMVKALQRMDQKMSMLGKEVTQASDNISSVSKDVKQLKSKQHIHKAEKPKPKPEPVTVKPAPEPKPQEVEKPKPVVERIEEKSNFNASFDKTHHATNAANKNNSELNKPNTAKSEAQAMMDSNQVIPKPKAKPKPPKYLSSVTKSQDGFSNTTWKVHAIIPGRAWLKNPNGNAITVTEGEMIEGFGKVLAIDAPSSSVVTSSGKVIR